METQKTLLESFNKQLTESFTGKFNALEHDNFKLKDKLDTITNEILEQSGAMQNFQKELSAIRRENHGLKLHINLLEQKEIKDNLILTGIEETADEESKNELS